MLILILVPLYIFVFINEFYKIHPIKLQQTFQMSILKYTQSKLKIVVRDLNFQIFHFEEVQVFLIEKLISVELNR